MDTDGALQAIPDGILFADWIEQQGISKSTAYKWRSELGIHTAKRRIGSRVEVWLSAGQQALMERYAAELSRGVTTATALERMGITPSESVALQQQAPPESVALQWTAPVETDGDRLNSRLEAAERAITTGLGLSTSETAWVLGFTPRSSPVTRGGITATRTGWNCWRLTRVE